MHPRHHHPKLRWLAMLLTVQMVLLPAVVLGSRGHCPYMRDTPSVQTSKSPCCGESCQSAQDCSSTKEKHDPKDDRCRNCPGCMTACLRPADVVHTLALVREDQRLVAWFVPTDTSLYEPICCNAIFHPPRA